MWLPSLALRMPSSTPARKQSCPHWAMLVQGEPSGEGEGQSLLPERQEPPAFQQKR